MRIPSQDTDLAGNEDLESAVAYPTRNTGMCLVVDADNIAGVDQKSPQEWILTKLSKLMSL